MNEPPVLPDDIEMRLRAAHAGVARGLDADAVLQQVRAIDGGYSQYGYREQAVLFHGEALEQLTAIVTGLTRSALAHGGFKAEALGGHIATACAKHTADEAVDYLARMLGHPSIDFTIGEAVRAHFLSKTPITIGRCTVYPSLEAAVPNNPPEALQAWQKKDYPGAVITATVNAHDPDSAYLRAVDAIDEAKAIMWLVTDQRDTARRAPTLTINDGRIVMHSSGGPPGLGNQYLTKEMLVHPYTFVSVAARREPSERTDWERRIIASARWHYQAGTATWPSAALTDSMTALEALLLPTPAPSRGKGDKLAATLHALGAEPWSPPGQKFKPWFIRLYRHRNDTTHEGVAYEEDLEITRLLGITKTAIRWAAGHLDPFHPNHADGPCTTLDEALREHC